MTFNVRGTLRDIGTKNAWRRRAALNVATIERSAPDVIGLQECRRGNLKAYRKNLPGYSRVLGPRYGNALHREHNAILYAPARLRLLDSGGGFWLSETPERYSRGWQAKVVHSANWALLELPEAGLTLLHLNTHLDHESELARQEGSKLIRRRAEELAEGLGDAPPIVVTGDFNSRPGSPTHRNFAAAGFADTHLAAGNGDAQVANTFHAFEGARFRDAHPGHGPRRIDWILLKDPRNRLRTGSHETVRDGDERAGLYRSDHYPALADLVPTR